MNIIELVNQLKISKDFYYNGRPIMTDAEFDQLENKLRELDPNNAYFDSVGTPVRGQKFKHLIPMGSLNQVNSEVEIRAWLQKMDNPTLIASNKLDGNSIAIYYDSDGYFECALTRGDGIEGLDITRHFNRMFKRTNPPIPKIATPDLIVRCEAIFKKSDFEAYVTGYKNPRNYVAGQLNRTIADQAFIDYCEVVAFNSNIDYITYSASLEKLNNLNFNVVTYYNISAATPSNYEEFLVKLLASAKELSPYELDGIVIEADEVDIQKSLGLDNLNPNYAVKFKINQEYVDTVVTNVEWNPSKHGFMKPRVQFEPIDLAGVTISFATGFNAKFIEENGIGPGAVVRIQRSGEVIPYIVACIERANPQMPDLSHDDFHWTPTGVDIVLNELPDESSIKGMVEFFTSIDVAQLKLGNVTALYEAGFNSITSIIKASEDDLTVVLGENGTKAYMSLRDRLTSIEEYKFAGSLPIFGRGVGKRRMKVLAEHHGDLTKITYDDILSTPGFDEITAIKISNAIPFYVDILTDLGDYVGIEKYIRIEGDLNGIAVCFTGVRNKELEKIIESKGGKVLSSATKEMTHLVAKDPSGKSGKLDKARKAGVTILSLEEAQSTWA